jgi:hypothetical protein
MLLANDSGFNSLYAGSREMTEKSLNAWQLARCFIFHQTGILPIPDQRSPLKGYIARSIPNMN